MEGRWMEGRWMEGRSVLEGRSVVEVGWSLKESGSFEWELMEGPESRRSALDSLSLLFLPPAFNQH